MTEQRAFLLTLFISVLIVADATRSSSIADEAAETKTGLNATRFPSSSASSPSTRLSSILEKRSYKRIEDNVTANEDENDDDDDDDDDEEEYEGEEVAVEDEYAEELRSVAESHEAMSRNEEQSESRDKTPDVSKSSKDSGKPRTSIGDDSIKRDFDSRERSVEEGSDESETSNETAIDGKEPEDEEVSELIKYKGTSRFKPGDDQVKRKRVPTVKKELSTQAEIKTANDSETRIEKRFSTKEMLDELNKQVKETGANDSSVKIEELPAEETEPDEYFDKKLSSSSNKQKINFKSSDLDTQDIRSEGPRKPDKRQETVLRDLETYLRAEYAAEQEQQQKLEELGAQEGALAESLLELLVKLAENPRRWKRVHRLLMDVEGGLELSRQALEARKRAFNLTSMASATTETTSAASTAAVKQRKKPKKKKTKKKKKKQRHHRFSTTTTVVPTAVPLLTTTESPWLTTPMQWRLVAERLFGPPWPQDLQDDPGLAKVRFTVPLNSRTPASSPGRGFVDQLTAAKQRDDHKALNDERQALMLESSREYTQPRHVHYGKVNTHQGVTSHSMPNRDNSRVRDYDPPELGYSRGYDYPRGRTQADEYYPVQSYAQNREYRPPGREYAASKSWQDSKYNYGIPSWKSEDASLKWSWPQLEGTKGDWPRESYWPRMHHDDESKVWQDPQRAGADNWDGDSWVKSSPWSSGRGNQRGDFARDESLKPPWNAQNNRPDPTSTKTGRVQLEDSTKLIKIKGWNEGQENWPFKLKDQKDLDGLRHEAKYAIGNKPAKINAQKNLQTSWNKDDASVNAKPNVWPQQKTMAAISPKIQSVGAWVMPVDQSTWKPYNLKAVGAEEGAGSRVGESSRHRWNVDMDTNPRTWPPKIGEDQWSNKFAKTGNGVAGWPKWKQFAYHRVTAMPSPSNGVGSSVGEGVRGRNNAYIAVSAVSPKYNGNQWRKNDIEETPIVRGAAAAVDGGVGGGAAAGSQDPEHPVNQLRGNGQRKQTGVYNWQKKNASPDIVSNATDPLEEQLETLRRGVGAWSHDENRDNIKKQLNVISDASETLATKYSSSVNSSSVVATTSDEKINRDNNNGKNVNDDERSIEEGDEIFDQKLNNDKNEKVAI